MAILGIETGATSQGGIGPQNSTTPQPDDAFQESPLHVRLSDTQMPTGSWDFMFWSSDTNGQGGSDGGIGTATIEYVSSYPGNPALWWQDGKHVVLFPPSQSVGVFVTLGSGYGGVTYTQFWGQPPPGGETGAIYAYVCALGGDSSYTFLMGVINPPGVYQCLFGFDMANGFFPGPQPSFQLPASASCQIVSSDLTQTIDVTPAGTGTTAQTPGGYGGGGTIFTIDTVALFGRKVSFFPQVKMSQIGTFNFDPTKLLNGHGSLDFGPKFASPVNVA